MVHIICLILLVATFSKAATNSIGCNYPEITNAVAAVQEGDTIQIASGTCIISNTININRGISFTLKGSGSNLTHLIAGAGSLAGFNVSNNSTNLLTISDIDAINGIDTYGYFSTGNNPPGSPLNGIVRFTSIQMTNVQKVGMTIGYCDSRTLVDHCYFVVPSGNNQSWNCIQFYGNEFRSWTNINDNPLGTIRVNMVEDCTFINLSGQAGNGFFDGYSAGQSVVRHCYFDGDANTGTHGYDSQVTSHRTLEVYNNIFTNVSTIVCNIRGGVFLFYSNEVWQINNITNIGPKLTYYRGCADVYQGTYGYVGYDKTNTYSINWVDGGRVDIGSTPYFFANDLTPFVNSGGYVQLGGTLTISVSNLVSAINCLPSGAGVRYTAITTNNDDIFGKINADFKVTQVINLTNIVLHNVMDGTNASGSMPTGYPAAMQPGLLAFKKFTNSPVTLFPCYQWSNTIHYSNNSSALAKWQLDYATLTNSPNYITSLMVENRDYYNDTIPANYTTLVYPHPADTDSLPPAPLNAYISLPGGLSIPGGVSFK